MRALRHTLAAVALTLVATPIFAQSNCAPRDQVIENLETKYGETLVGAGLQSEVAIFEVYASLERGTWTIIQTRIDGTVCVMSSGTHWNVPLPSSTEPSGTKS